MLRHQNARTHGLTAKMAPASARDWYRIILNEPNATLEIDQLVSEREAAALTLAGCEVRRLETELVLRNFEEEQDPLHERRIELARESRKYLILQLENDFDKRHKTLLGLMIRMLLKDFRTLEKDILKRGRLLKRYHREALSAHRKAFNQWVHVLKLRNRKIPKQTDLHA